MRNAENVEANYLGGNLDQQVTNQVAKMAGRGVRFHHGILRFGDTIYENLRETAAEVDEEIAKVEKSNRYAVRPARKGILGTTGPPYTKEDAERDIAKYKKGMKIVEIKVGEIYHHFGDGKRMRTHGVNDGFHGSARAR